MALAAAIQWEVRTTGSDTQCGGGFKAGATGTDYSQQNTAQKSGADLTMHAVTNTKVSPVAAKVAAADVGNVIQITAGTGWTTGFYEITAQDGGDPGYWTLDRSPASAGEANLGTYYMGGALASPGMAGSGHVAGNTIWIKSGTYNIASATPNVSTGPLSLTTGANYTVPTCVTGFGTTHGDLGTKPILQASTASVTFLTLTTRTIARNLELDGNSQTASLGISGTSSINNGEWAISIIAKNMVTGGFLNVRAYGCSATANAGYGFSGCKVVFCEAYANTATGFIMADHDVANHCISSANSGASSDGFSSTGSGGQNGVFIGCIAYGNGRDGFRTIGAGYATNCIAEANSGVGFSGVSSSVSAWLFNCAAYNNTGGAYTANEFISGYNAPGFVAVTTGSVFTNAAGRDFSLNNTATRGALLRATGYPATFPAGTTASYRDIGAAQHADPAATGPLVGPSALISV